MHRITKDQGTPERKKDTMTEIDTDKLAEAQELLRRQQAAQQPTIPVTYQERVEEVANAVHHPPVLTSIDQLIEDARKKLGAGTHLDSGAEHPAIEASDPAMLNALAAERASLYREKKELEQRIAAIDDIAKGILGEKDHDLKANGVTVVTYRPVTSRVLNQAHIKKLFPDVPENRELWQDQTSRRIDWKG